ncbi:MAG: hypothetical protein FWG30_09540 [Eubacteriaceae bacterium]|jgi:hypothetical protein|nr:hypothetical protein [Eubacteriaceae bacterium]
MSITTSRILAFAAACLLCLSFYATAYASDTLSDLEDGIAAVGEEGPDSTAAVGEEGPGSAAAVSEEGPDSLGGLDEQGSDAGAAEGNKQYFLTIAAKVDEYADGDGAETKYAYDIIFNKGTPAESTETLTLRNKGAKVYKLKEGTTYEIISKDTSRYAVNYSSSASGSMSQNRTVTTSFKASTTFSLTIKNDTQSSIEVEIKLDGGSKSEVLTLRKGESKAIKNIPKGTSYSCIAKSEGVEIANSSGNVNGNVLSTATGQGPGSNGSSTVPPQNSSDDDDEPIGDDDDLGWIDETGDNDNDDSPKTGDYGLSAIWGTVSSAALSAGAYIAAKKKKRF